MNTFLVAGATLLLSGGMAAAAPVYFDLQADMAPVTSWTLTENGLTMTVTGGAFVGGLNFPSSTTVPDDSGNDVTGYEIGVINTYDGNAYIDPDPDGTGVLNNGGFDGDDDIDGSGWDEFLILSFDQDVTLDVVEYARLGFNDNYRYIFDTTGDGVLGAGDFVTLLGSGTPDTTIPKFTGSVFGILATEDDDEYAVSRVGISVAPVSAVPLPAAGWMLLAGVGAFGLMRRRK